MEAISGKEQKVYFLDKNGKEIFSKGHNFEI